MALSACGGEEKDALPERLQTISPTDTPRSPVTPTTTPMSGMRTITGQGYSLQIPSAWEDQATPASENRPASHFFFPRDRRGADAPRGGVVLDTAPVSDVIEQSQALYLSKKSTEDGSTARRSPLTWPGAQRAVLVEWTQMQGDTPQDYRQLMVQVDPKLIVNVVVSAPSGTLAQNHLDESMASLKVTT